ncbi:MAG: alanine/glycine:cation symporter family protein [Planctomycetota bacterium]
MRRRRRVRAATTGLATAAVLSLIVPVWALGQDAGSAPEAAAEAKASWWESSQQGLEDTFAAVNEWLVPVLFFDVGFGLFDPSPEAVETGLVQARAELAALEAAPSQPDDDARRALRLAGQKVATLESQAAALAEGTRVYGLPLIVVFLLLGGVFFTLRFGFVNLRLFGHSVAVIRGRYDNPNDHGEVSHFQALTAALSATVGLGNIAGVAIAISQGGAGAVFWMWFVAFFGMSSKFSSCTLAQMYRRISDERGGGPDGKKREHVLGGPMLYLAEGMKDVCGKTVGTPLGKVLAVMFAVFAIGGSLGGGNLFQGNQTFAIVGDVVFNQTIEGEDALLQRVEGGDASAARELRELRAEAVAEQQRLKEKYDWVGGLIMAVLVGAVIVGGIRRIGEVTSKLVPTMCVFYVGVCGVIVLFNFGQVPTLLGDIVAGAFSGEAMAWGGLMGVLVIGVKRGAFSNEAGLGSAAIAHSAAKTDEPVREGVVAMIGPFIDTIVVCTMTALAILITGAHLEGSAGGFTNEGVGITASAFSSLAPWLTVALMAAVFVFAYSTMISWSYYGERASEYLFGGYGIWPFRAVFLLFVFASPLLTLDNVITFTDLLILSMAYPNILGMLLLSGKVSAAARDYAGRLRSGQMKTTAQRQAAAEGEPSI